jgi:cytochrome c-type biogenesis protein CcmF
VNATLGGAANVLGLSAAAIGAITVAFGLVKHRPELVRIGRRYAWITLACAIASFVIMERALITRDFTVLFVAENGSSRTPAIYNFATLWSALEGSIILWALVLNGFVAASVVKFRDRIDDPLFGWALLTMYLVVLFFFVLLVGPANPFKTFEPPAGYDGPGPNPLLQNHVLMAFHPPMLYLGYVGFTVPFAFAIGALATGRVGEGWLVATRRWTLIAWGFLTAGIILGAWWSYEVLGWGGYWAWDPVENASFLPWLTGTAYLHSVMVQERRGMLRVWNLSLLCATFALTILGTFLTRSGVVESVHAFSNSTIGPVLLGFFGVIVAVTVGLIGWRGDRLRSPGRIDSPLSREGAFLANNVVFAAFAFVVLLGTVFPLIVEAVNGDRISIGTPYFERMSMPIGLVLLFLMSVAPVLPWRKASGELLSQRLFWPAWGAVGAMALAVVVGARGITPLIGYGLGGFAGGAALRQIVLATRRQGWRGFVGRANGGMVVHLGVIIIAVGLVSSASFIHQQELQLTEGQTGTVAGHEITFRGLTTKTLPEKTITQAQLQIDGGKSYAPGISVFAFSGQNIGTPSVRSTLTHDIMLTVLAFPEAAGDPVTVRVVVQPMIIWLWIGGAVMAIGTLFAAFPGRRRNPLAPTSALTPSSEPLDGRRPAAAPVGASARVTPAVEG